MKIFFFPFTHSLHSTLCCKLAKCVDLFFAQCSSRAREMQTLASESGDSKNELMIVINDHAQLKTKKVIAIASRERERLVHTVDFPTLNLRCLSRSATV